MNQVQMRNKIRLINKCNMLIKSDRINCRIQKFADTYDGENKQEIKKFAKTIQIMVAQVLSNKNELGAKM